MPGSKECELKFRNTSVAFVACLACAMTSAQAPSVPSTPKTIGPLVTIASLDVPRYMGTWYEIAKYPNYFQKKCVANTRANYQLQASGTVQVTNQCRTSSGEIDEAVGEARQIGPATSPKLQVRFAPAWLSFVPFVWGDYWVIDLDDGYQLAAVSEPKRDFLWILSRSPQVSATAYDALVVRLQNMGFDPNRLARTTQNP